MNQNSVSLTLKSLLFIRMLFFHYCFIVYLLKESEAFGPCKGLCRLLNVNCFVITPSLKNLELLSRASTNF